MPTLEDLLRTKVASDNGVEFSPDFRVAVQEVTDDGVRIIAHPLGYSGETLDFWVKQNALVPL